MNRRSLLVSSLTAFAFPLEALATPQQLKSLVVVPRRGELAGETVYTNSFAVIIGITKYPNLPKDKQLDFSVKDATDLRNLLIASFGFLPENITLLTNEQATKVGIEKALSALGNGQRIKETDRVLVYFSGHGQTVPRPGSGETGFLIPHDAKVDLDHPENRAAYSETCLRMETIWQYLEDCNARHRLLLLDACFGGLIFKTKALGNKPSAVVVKGLLARPALQAIT
ncbi:MAG: caspase family protein, partial [Armatimonadetes bacterium]|nr:caspase family protein [Armatimonadota bacterium]